jgi:hypothetical protein
VSIPHAECSTQIYRPPPFAYLDQLGVNAWLVHKVSWLDSTTHFMHMGSCQPADLTHHLMHQSTELLHAQMVSMWCVLPPPPPPPPLVDQDSSKPIKTGTFKHAAWALTTWDTPPYVSACVWPQISSGPCQAWMQNLWRTCPTLPHHGCPPLPAHKQHTDSSKTHVAGR